MIKRVFHVCLFLFTTFILLCAFTSAAKATNDIVSIGTFTTNDDTSKLTANLSTIEACMHLIEDYDSDTGKCTNCGLAMVVGIYDNTTETLQKVYPTVNAAAAASEYRNGEYTLKLLSDSVESSISVQGKQVWDLNGKKLDVGTGNIYISSNVDLTIKSSGSIAHITSSGSTYDTIRAVNSGSKLSFENIIVENTGNNDVVSIEGGMTVTLKNGAILKNTGTGYGAYIASSGTMVMEPGATVISSENYGLYLQKGTVYLYGGAVNTTTEDKAGIYVNNSNTENAKLVVCADLGETVYTVNTYNVQNQTYPFSKAGGTITQLNPLNFRYYDSSMRYTPMWPSSGTIKSTLYMGICNHNTLTNNACTTCGKPAEAVISSHTDGTGTPTYYFNFAEALSAVRDGQKLKLLSSCSTGDVALSYNFTLDLNGCTLTCTSTFSVNSLTIMDSSESKNGKLVMGVSPLTASGNLILNSGMISAPGAAVLLDNADSTLTVNGGCIMSETETKAAVSALGTVILNIDSAATQGIRSDIELVYQNTEVYGTIEVGDSFKYIDEDIIAISFSKESSTNTDSVKDLPIVTGKLDFSKFTYRGEGYMLNLVGDTLVITDHVETRVVSYSAGNVSFYLSALDVKSEKIIVYAAAYDIEGRMTDVSIQTVISPMNGLNTENLGTLNGEKINIFLLDGDYRPLCTVFSVIQNSV